MSGGYVRWQGKEKLTTLAHFTFHPNLSSQLFNDAEGDRKSQSLSRGVNGSDLIEGFEQSRLIVWVKARAVVTCPETDHAVWLG